MIKNIVFDLGNVLLDFNPLDYLKAKGIEDSVKCKEIFNEIFKSEEWLMLDRGTITEEEAIRVLCERSKGNSELIKLAMDNWYDILTPIDGTVKILEEIRNAGYNLYVLSNFHLLAYENVTKRYPFFKYFHGDIISYKENVIKPEEEIYIRLIKRYNIIPEETIFIDDTLENVEAAKVFGINGIVFKSPDNLREELKRYKINI
ncbi:HAD family hydrolase [Clostridium intestinale]|uniref:HAD superfamily hydrolase n=2 Tax=Clostridium intestinale TaxID=36845 RepID=U2N5S6_9CLOT|nr:HAD family phosphatase [Clostridium intestinale]ERK30867.1 HAD superfamily hydrolase [Clostridium intestinale URNW]QLY81656.1 HAD family phosphatase [Clostridium intestinale]